MAEIVVEKHPILQLNRKPRVGRPPKWLKELEASRQFLKIGEPLEKRPKRTYQKKRSTKKDDDDDEKSLDQLAVEVKARSFIADSEILPAERESWKRHSEFLYDFINVGENPIGWSKNDVSDFVAAIPGCDSNVESLTDHQIDGESFLQLSQSDITHILKFKMGPAVKLYNSILILRERYCDKKTSEK